MGAKSRIEWTEATWNPVTGCTPVSPGCAHCYAASIARRFPESHCRCVVEDYDRGGYELVRHPFSHVHTHEHSLGIPLRWMRPRRVFVCSMGDLFHEQVPDEFIAAVFDVMTQEGGNHHTYQVLTKRPARALDFLTRYYLNGRVPPLPNVWIGVTAEDQERADERIPLLLQTPAAVRFVSIEPMLGQIDLWAINDGSWYDHEGATQYNALTGAAWWGGTGDHGLGGGPKLDWVICGGESGPGARPMSPEWARQLRDSCADAGVPFLFKQWGSVVRCDQLPEVESTELDRGENTHDLCGSREYITIGKRRAGRELDGAIHDGYPEACHG